MRDGVFWGGLDCLEALDILDYLDLLDFLEILDYLEIFSPANIQKTNQHMAKHKVKLWISVQNVKICINIL